MEKIIVLVMGLPGSGKTTLANKLAPMLNAKRLNGDDVRRSFDHWDFSKEGRIQQAKRMFFFAEKLKKKDNNVIAEFVCPTLTTRKCFPADYIVWVNTIKKGRFNDTNKMFVKPKKFDCQVTTQDAEKWATKIVEDINEKLFNL